MIQSCKYCLSQRHLCPRCEGPVEVRSVVVYDGNTTHSTSLILCVNIQCKNYGSFKQQTAESIEVIVCEDCRRQAKEKEAHVET